MRYAGIVRVTHAALVIVVAACGDAASPAAKSSPNTAPIAPIDAGTPPSADASTAFDAGGCPGSAGCTDASNEAGTQAPYVAIFSAFPAEMAPLLAQATISSTTTINGKNFRIGTLKGVRVAIGLTGMGLGPASATAKAAIAQLPVTGVVFSGVAGSKLNIGDVTVPTSWSLKKSVTFAPDPTWLQLAQDIATAGTLCLENCTVVPSTGLPVCMAHAPTLAIGGVGQSDDVSVPMNCQAGGDDVFGCDVGAPAAASSQCQPMGALAADAGAGSEVEDNETAAVAAEAAARGLPFIAFRGVSDGAGDPLSLPGFPTQFFAYYRLAARNAAASTIAFVERLSKAAP